MTLPGVVKLTVPESLLNSQRAPEMERPSLLNVSILIAEVVPLETEAQPTSWLETINPNAVKKKPDFIFNDFI